MNAVTVVGAGLAGSEAAYQLAIRGIPVRLIEMKPKKMTPAHVSPYFAELVCSNSLRSDELTNAVGLLKEELRRLGSIVMRCADEHRVAAGGALAVDREGFARAVTEAVRALPNVEIVEEEAVDIPDGEVIIASGPLTSDALAENILRRTQKERTRFVFDALTVDLPSRRVTRDGREVALTALEFDLLAMLVRRNNVALSREALLAGVWGYAYQGETRTVDVHIQRLRGKIGAEYIETVYKYGYRFCGKEVERR